MKQHNVYIIGTSKIADGFFDSLTSECDITQLTDMLSSRDTEMIAKNSDIVFINTKALYDSDGLRDMTSLYDLIDDIVTATEKYKGTPKLFVDCTASLPGTNGILTRLFDEHTFAIAYQIDDQILVGANSPRTRNFLASLLLAEFSVTALQAELLRHTKEYFLIGVAHLHKEIKNWCEAYNEPYKNIQTLLEDVLSQNDVDNFDKITKDRKHKKLAKEILKEAELRGVQSPILKTITGK